METYATKTLQTGHELIYVLRHDDRGYYFEGLKWASWRRKTRAAVERDAERLKFDIVDR